MFMVAAIPATLPIEGLSRKIDDKRYSNIDVISDVGLSFATLNGKQNFVSAFHWVCI